MRSAILLAALILCKDNSAPGSRELDRGQIDLGEVGRKDSAMDAERLALIEKALRWRAERPQTRIVEASWKLNYPDGREAFRLWVYCTETLAGALLEPGDEIPDFRELEVKLLRARLAKLEGEAA